MIESAGASYFCEVSSYSIREDFKKGSVMSVLNSCHVSFLCCSTFLPNYTVLLSINGLCEPMYNAQRHKLFQMVL